MSVILVEGGRKLSGAVTVQGAKNSVLPMLAATVLCPGICCLRGCPTLSDVDTAVQIIRHLGGTVRREGPDLVVDTRQITGCEICSDGGGICLKSSGRLRGVPPVRTSPYPGFPTDDQALLMAALTRSRGSTVFVENLFADRFRHVPQLIKMGAQIHTQGQTAIVTGVQRLQGAAVQATDLRGGAALVVAGLQAQGVTRVEQIHHIERGYADIVGDLSGLGACIYRED